MTALDPNREHAGHDQSDVTRPLIVVTCDSHVGPRLKEDLRPYCEQKYISDFDDFVAAEAEAQRTADRLMGAQDFDRAQFMKNQATTGHYDIHARLRDMDYDGVACEVIFHGSQN